MVIDGISLDVALNAPMDQQKRFFDVATKAPAVVCCRCSPTQKSLVVERIKLFTRQITCAIGDGGNDVSMIQSAHVGKRMILF
jgi:phospholipid-translocating ATPase